MHSATSQQVPRRLDSLLVGWYLLATWRAGWVSSASFGVIVLDAGRGCVAVLDCRTAPGPAADCPRPIGIGSRCWSTCMPWACQRRLSSRCNKAHNTGHTGASHAMLRETGRSSPIACCASPT